MNADLDRSRSLPQRATRAALISGFLAFFFLAHTGSALADAVQITFNDATDGWDGSNMVTYGGHVLYHEDLDDIHWYDGISSTPVQAYDAGIPALDRVASFVFSLGSGSSPGQVVGAWRRGASFAWVWTSDQAPVAVDTYAANLLDPTMPTNPEAVAIAAGCVFMVMQANDGGTVVRRVFQVDTLTGQPQTVSGSASVFGASRVATSQCRAAWVWDPNDNGTGNALPLELQYFDGTTTVTLDRGLIGHTDFDLSGDRLVYIKRVDGMHQVLTLDVSDPAATPRVVSTSSWPKVNPQTDGRHVAWAERVTSAEPFLHRIMLDGDIDLTPRATQWVERESHFVFTLSRGQLSWERDGDLFLLAGNEVVNVDHDPAPDAWYPQLSAGTIAFTGRPPGDSDNEVFVWVGTPPAPGTELPPPLFLRADLGPGRVILRWDSVLGADSYNVYYAETSGVTPGNYHTLPGGTRLTATTNSMVVEGLDPTTSYFFVVTSDDRDGESGESGEVTPRGFLVDTTLDQVDANPGDGVCMTGAGLCSLRAAIQEANAANSGLSVAVPAGTYLLTLAAGESVTTDDLDLLGHMTIVGAGRDDTIIDGNQFDRVIQSSPVDTGTVVLADLTVRNGDRHGILNEGALRLERVAVVDNGPWDQAGGIDQSGTSLEIFDSLIARNQAGSHGGGIRTRYGHIYISGSRFEDNTAGIGGGAIYVFPTTDSVVVRGTEFTRNSDLGQFNGGAIFNERSRVHVHDSALHGNDSNRCGGAVYVTGGELYMVNVTVSGNSSATGGGAICAQSYSASAPSEISLDNVTIYHNTDTSSTGENLHLSDFTTTYVKNSILSTPDGPTGINCGGAIAPVSLGFNLESGDSCGFGPDDLVNTDPMLGVLDDNGGPTQNHAPMSGSPAIDGGDPAGCVSQLGSSIAFDQRGAARPFDGDGDGSARCDIGAFEDLGDCTDGDGDGFTAGPDPRCAVSEQFDCDDVDDAVFPGAAQVCDGLNNDCYHPAWPGLAGTNESDGDGDGLSTCAGDCLDTDGAVTGRPGEVEDVLFANPTSFDWAVPSDPGGTIAALSFDVNRSASASDPTLDGQCLASMQGGQVGTDPATPAAGAAFYYLVRARNACPAGIGTWGFASSGAERTANTCP